MAGGTGRSPQGVDISVPNHARVYDYFLGGKDNFAADRLAAQKIAAVAPDTALLARANRQFLVRAVRSMAQAGIRQFIDLGTGIPTSPSVHEVAHGIEPSARVVYVDNDPMVTTHNAALLASDDGVISILGNLTQPEELLANSKLQAIIDFDEPIGLLFVAVLHLIPEAQDPGGIVARFVAPMAAGSQIAICQFSAESDPAAIRQFEKIYENSTIRVTFRTHDQIRHFFDGLELLPPGVVEVEKWRPTIQPFATRLKIVGGIGRKR